MNYLSNLSKATLSFLLFVFLCYHAVYAQNSNTKLQPGKHAVGFKTIHAVDMSRNYKDKTGRPVQIALWYPAQKQNNAEEISYTDYVQLALEEEGKTEHRWEETEENLASWISIFENRSADSTLIWNELLKEPINVYNGVSGTEDALPLIVYGAGSQGEAFENSVLFEYLASHGYMVAAVPSIGTYWQEMNIDSRGLETQARDLEFAIQHLRQDAYLKIDKIITAGWSWGGLAAMLVQVRNTYVEAVVSMDGSIATHIDKIKAFPYFETSKLTVPYLFFSTTESTYDRTKKFYNTLNYSESVLLRFNYIGHSDFTAYSYIARKNSDAEPLKTEAYEAVCTYIQAFLARFIKEASSAETYLEHSANQNGFSKELLTIERQGAFPVPPQEGDFFDIITEEGAEKGWEIYEQVKERDPEYQIFEAYNLTVVAFRFVRDSARTDESVRIMEMVLDEYPDSYSSYALKGRIHEIRGETLQAYSNFNKAYGMALMDGQTPGHAEEMVFYNDINWYKSRIDDLEMKFENK